MTRSKLLTLVAVLALISAGAVSCAKKDHWGQDLNPKKNWWKTSKEGQSWDRKNKIFMAIGYSNPDWTDKFDARKSADLNARAEVATFMQSLVKNYMREIRNSQYAISEGIVESSANETVLGSVIVARKYKKKRYMSLIKVDLGYFFQQIYDRYRRDQAARVRGTGSHMTREELDRRIEEKTDQAIENLKAMENQVVEKTIEEAISNDAQ